MQSEWHVASANHKFCWASCDYRLCGIPRWPFLLKLSLAVSVVALSSPAIIKMTELQQWDTQGILPGSECLSDKLMDNCQENWCYGLIYLMTTNSFVHI